MVIFVPLGFKLYWAGIVSNITLLSSSNVLKFPIRWKIPIIGVFVLLGCITKWKRNSYEKLSKTIYTRNWGVQEWSYAHCKATTCKSCASFGILHWNGWKNDNLRVHVEQKLGLLPLWSNIFPLPIIVTDIC